MIWDICLLITGWGTNARHGYEYCSELHVSSPFSTEWDFCLKETVYLSNAQWRNPLLPLILQVPLGQERKWTNDRLVKDLPHVTIQLESWALCPPFPWKNTHPFKERIVLPETSSQYDKIMRLEVIFYSFEKVLLSSLLFSSWNADFPEIILTPVWLASLPDTCCLEDD